MNRITLKSIKHNDANSEGTPCYSATLYFDGKRVGRTRNPGNGGCDYTDTTDDAGWDRMEDYIKTLPADEMTIGNDIVVIDESLEYICHKRVSEWLQERDIKRQMRGKLCYYRGTWANTFEWLSTKRNPEPMIREWLKRNRPDSIILNDLPMEKLIELWDWREEEAA